MAIRSIPCKYVCSNAEVIIWLIRLDKAILVVPLPCPASKSPRKTGGRASLLADEEHIDGAEVEIVKERKGG